MLERAHTMHAIYGLDFIGNGERDYKDLAAVVSIDMNEKPKLVIC